MRATWRPLPAWPHPRNFQRSSPFSATTDATLSLLEREIESIDGSDVVIGLVVPESAIGLSGALRNGMRTRADYPGAEVSFDVPKGRAVFATDVFSTWQDNLRAIALGLEALRRVDRYGIAQGGEQYAGYLQLGTGDPVARGAALVREAGSVEAAIKRHHPDKGGTDAAMADINAYRATLPARAGR